MPWLLRCGDVAIHLAVSRVLLAQFCSSSGCVQLLWFLSAAGRFISFQLSCFPSGAFGNFGSAEGTSSGLMGEWGQCLFRAAGESQFPVRDWTLGNPPALQHQIVCKHFSVQNWPASLKA